MISVMLCAEPCRVSQLQRAPSRSLLQIFDWCVAGSVRHMCVPSPPAPLPGDKLSVL
jgi:hypothetical protein